MTSVKSALIIGYLSVYALKCREAGLADSLTENLIDTISNPEVEAGRKRALPSDNTGLPLTRLADCGEQVFVRCGDDADIDSAIIVVNDPLDESNGRSLAGHRL